MDELSDAARRLIDLATAEDEPPAEAVDESWGMLVQRVQRDSAAALESSSVVATAAARRDVRRFGVVTALVVVGIATWLVVRSSSPSSLRPAAPVVTPTTDATPPSPVVDERAPAPPPPPASRAPAVDGPGLLDEAEATLATDPERALALLVRHAAVDTDADLVPRRLALRVRCLCALGRHDDARHEATAFLERHGDTAFAAAVRDGCGGAAPPRP